MRPCTYVHPGENLVCVGCHENRTRAPARNQVPMAFKRPPSGLVPNLQDGSCPLTYARLVEPVLENKCYPCHEEKKKPRPNLEDFRFFFNGTGGGAGLEDVHGGYRTIPGKFGSLHSGIAEILLKKHHREVLSMEEINRVTLWVDANCNVLGAHADEAGQKAGKIVWPLIDTNPANPAGLDLFDDKPPPTPGAATPLMRRNEERIKRIWFTDKVEPK